MLSVLQELHNCIASKIVQAEFEPYTNLKNSMMQPTEATPQLMELGVNGDAILAVDVLYAKLLT